MFQTAFQSNAFQNNAFQIAGIEPTIDTHDGFTRDEIKRVRELDKKLEKARLKLIEAQKNKKLARKQSISDLVDPKPVVVEKQQIEPQKEVKDDSLKPIIKATQEIKKLELFKKQIELEVEARRQLAKIQHELAIYQARKLAEMDEEDALLVLMLS